MRLYQQIRASIARTAVAGLGVLVFASGMSVSASGQALLAPSQSAGGATTARRGVQPGPTGTPLSIEAVRMALENNLGIQAEKLNPQIQVYGVSRARAVYTPALLSGFSRAAAPSPRPISTRRRPPRRRPRMPTSPATAGFSSR